MTPTTVSQVIEALAKLLFGLSGAYFVMAHCSREFAVSGTVLGHAVQDAAGAQRLICAFGAAAAILGAFARRGAEPFVPAPARPPGRRHFARAARPRAAAAEPPRALQKPRAVVAADRRRRGRDECFRPDRRFVFADAHRVYPQDRSVADAFDVRGLHPAGKPRRARVDPELPLRLLQHGAHALHARAECHAGVRRQRCRASRMPLRAA